MLTCQTWLRIFSRVPRHPRLRSDVCSSVLTTGAALRRSAALRWRSGRVPRKSDSSAQLPKVRVSAMRGGHIEELLHAGRQLLHGRNDPKGAVEVLRRAATHLAQDVRPPTEEDGVNFRREVLASLTTAERWSGNEGRVVELAERAVAAGIWEHPLQRPAKLKRGLPRHGALPPRDAYPLVDAAIGVMESAGTAWLRELQAEARGTAHLQPETHPEVSTQTRTRDARRWN